MISLRHLFRRPPLPQRAKTAITIRVADVKPARRRMRQEPYYAAVRHLIGRHVESASRYYGQLVRFGTWALQDHPANPLITALQTAYERHYPVVISPDIVWVTIAQGLARHIRLNSEELRDALVSWSGQQELLVERTDFVDRSPENPWAEVIATFSERIRAQIGPDRHELFVANFSTSTPVTRAAMEVALFDAMQPYFKYVTRFLCGIPTVILEGTSDDWQKMAARVQRFTELGLDQWAAKLVPILNTIADSAAGRTDRTFWQEMVHVRDVCGGMYMSGWVLALFPYFKDPQSKTEFRPSWVFEPLGLGTPSAAPQDFPNGFSEVPFKIQYGIDGPTRDMRFVGGLLGVAQDEDTLALRPEIGWAVCDDAPTPSCS